MAPYDAQFESLIQHDRQRRRLLIARGIKFSAATTDFKNFCRAKLTRPESVTFFWQEANNAWSTHRGWAMLGFSTRPDCNLAEQELQGLSTVKRVEETLTVNGRIVRLDGDSDDDDDDDE
ncbi:hypothetical protein K4F52_006799 [Lecanicillium sp. MT-2017a]|nr:hypothetical protein K4F52_006799 [Lecanicillium sp. MT-2017a]